MWIHTEKLIYYLVKSTEIGLHSAFQKCVNHNTANTAIFITLLCRDAKVSLTAEVFFYCLFVNLWIFLLVMETYLYIIFYKIFLHVKSVTKIKIWFRLMRLCKKKSVSELVSASWRTNWGSLLYTSHHGYWRV